MQGRGTLSRCARDLLKLMPKQEKYTEEKLEKILRALELDDYFEIISSDRKGEKMYVITLHPNGFAFKRSSVQMRRDMFFKVGWTIVSARARFPRRPFDEKAVLTLRPRLISVFSA